ncbi:BnaA08g12100D [Brassica napus]|uniref:BnaA08g12100D protein n=1 Tax=Brassica napus TaxID=3708 RepID=A0A078GD76_BRANA|nr:BnaA08g12100D [Brassica napus]
MASNSREARRRKILERGSDRLAFITVIPHRRRFRLAIRYLLMDKQLSLVIRKTSLRLRCLLIWTLSSIKAEQTLSSILKHWLKPPPLQGYNRLLQPHQS